MENIKDSLINILQPGLSIKPEIDNETVKSILNKIYKITCFELKQLTGYDDLNFLIIEADKTKKYVLKITNSMDSQKLSLVEAQIEIMLYLVSHNIHCPKPIKSIHGNYFERQLFPSGKYHIVRLFEYLEGQIMASVPKDDFLFYQVGENIAKMDRILKEFSHDAYENLSHVWMLEKLPELDNFKYAVKDPDLLIIVDEVIEAFIKHVIPKMSILEKGIIHGDVNEHNIVVNLKDSKKKDDWRITGILDFGDTQKSCYLFELAIAMAFMMLLTCDLKTGGIVLAGYSTIRHVPDEEMKLLKICVAARLCQNLVLSDYTFEQDPNNAYVLDGREEILKVLPMIWNESNDNIMKLWKSIADDYLTKSMK